MLSIIKTMNGYLSPIYKYKHAIIYAPASALAGSILWEVVSDVYHIYVAKTQSGNTRKWPWPPAINFGFYFGFLAGLRRVLHIENRTICH